MIAGHAPTISAPAQTSAIRIGRRDLRACSSAKAFSSPAPLKRRVRRCIRASFGRVRGLVSGFVSNRVTSLT